ncbi:MAG: cyclic nucleotide-binding domain-containing protein [Deltaproteobacteria bacterium]|nr:cyclic nucleotide-binding domain-containing protein [Deltaproteobacteria bacterium]
MRTRQQPIERIADGLSGQWISLEDIGALELFRSTKRPFKIKLNSNFAARAGTSEPGIKAAVRREYRPGDTICEAGAFGSTAFLLLEGTATAFVPEQPRPAPIPGRSRRSLLSLKGLFRRRSHSARADKPTETDVGEISAYATLARTGAPAPMLLHPGDVFGIDACVNLYPRAMTVQAEEPCVVVEMLRSVLDTIREAGTAGPDITSRYRETAIRQELYASSLFHDLAPDELDHLAARAALLTPDSSALHAGAIYREGAAADAVYLVRSGTVMLARGQNGAARILTYLGRGSAFGLEMLLVSSQPGPLRLRCISHPELPIIPIDKPLTIGRSSECEVALTSDNRAVGRRHCRLEARDGALFLTDLQSANFTLLNGERVQEAKVVAGDRISVVQYTFELESASADAPESATRRATATGLDNFEVVAVPLDEVRALAERNARVVSSTRAAAAALDAAISADTPVEPAIIGEVVALNLYNSQNVLLIDLDRCTRCDECVRACATAHDGVARFTRDGPRFGKYLVTMACRSCTDPKCMIGCPVGSIRRRDSLEIQIEDWCIGCQRCANQCPFGNINMLELAAKPELAPPVSEDVKLRATVCDLCSGYDGPNCVYACPHDAAIRVNPAAFLSAVDRP